MTTRSGPRWASTCSTRRHPAPSGWREQLTKAWPDDNYSGTLESNPQACRSRGRPHGAANAQVLIIRNFAGEAPCDNTEKMDAQITLWETGKQTGIYELHVPRTPQVDTAELSESELEGVAGGFACCCS